MIYQWKTGARPAVRSAQVVGGHLEALRQSEGGTFTAAAIVNAARPEEAPLHPCFEWDDTRAAELYRVDQARHLVDSIVVVREDAKSTPPVRAFVVVGKVGGAGRGYTSVSVVMEDPFARAEILARARKELLDWQRRYNELEEFAALFVVIQKEVA